MLFRSAAAKCRAHTGLLLACIFTLPGCSNNVEPAKVDSAQSSDPRLTIATSTLPVATAHAPYSVQLIATGGTAPYRWSVASGSLPSGLSLAQQTGMLSGTPMAAVTGATVTFEVTDSASTAQTATKALALSVTAPPPSTLTIATASLPTAVLGTAYAGTLAATGGTPPYAWSMTSGTLPAGLTWNASTQTIGGTPTGTAASTTVLAFEVQDSGVPAQTATATLPLKVTQAVTVPAITVAVAPARAAVTLAQPIALTATTNDPAGVTWTISPAGGAFSSTTGAAVTLTAPSTAGLYTVTATSVSNASKSASTTVAVTDLAGVYTYHDDLARDGANTHEYALTVANVNTSTFGKLFSCTVDGAIYAQPLWVANLTVNGALHNVVFVATQHDGLFAFDADASPCTQLWQANLIDGTHGGTTGETPVPGALTGYGQGDIAPEVGVTGTPVIDPSTNTLYVVSLSTDSGHSSFYQRLHAIDITTGNERASAPVLIAATFPGIGDGGSTDTFVPLQQNQRAGLAFVNGTVYICWSSHEDFPPFYGWMMGYTYSAASGFTQSAVFNTAPNVQYGGIWMGAGAPAADASNNLYVITGNADFDANLSAGYNNDYGDSLLQLTGGLAVTQYFTPTDWESDWQNDNDFGAGGAAILADLPAGSPVTHLIMGGGKDQSLYVLNRDALGGVGDSNAWQQIAFNAPIHATGAFWNDNYYVAGAGGPLTSYALSTTTAKFSLGTTSSNTFGFPGATPAVSASGSSNGIVWGLDNSQYCTNQSPGCGPAVLYAYDATNVGKQLWSSSQVSSDAAGLAVKFQLPIVANGKVYVGTRGNNTGGASGSTSVNGELDVYALKTN